MTKRFLMLSAAVLSLLLSAAVPVSAQRAVSQKTELVIPPLQIAEAAAKGEPAGDWKAPENPLDYAETKAKAEKAEAAGKAAEALTLWERVIDRTSCSETNRIEARKHIHDLRPKVQYNTDPAKANQWTVLVLVLREIQFDRKRTVKEKDTEGKEVDKELAETVHKMLTDEDMDKIGKQLAGWRDMVFNWSSGQCLLNFDVMVIAEVYDKDHGRDFAFPRHAAVPFYNKAKEKFSKEKYNTLIAYAPCDGTGPGVSQPWVAACYGHCGEFAEAGYIMVPWKSKYPFGNEEKGEMELHEWLHQIDDDTRRFCGYPRAVAQDPDGGRMEGDNRAGGDNDYRRTGGVKNWTQFYKHILSEHLTRQIWSEMNTERSRHNSDKRPGLVSKITAE